MLWESLAFHLVPFHCKKKTVSPGLTRVAAHNLPPTSAQVNSCIVAPAGSAARIASDVQAAVAGVVGDEDGAVGREASSDWGRPADAVPQMLWESSAFHLVPFHRKKKTVSPGLTRVAAHNLPPTSAQVNFSIVAPAGSAARIASDVQAAVAGVVGDEDG